MGFYVYILLSESGKRTYGVGRRIQMSDLLHIMQARFVLRKHIDSGGGYTCKSVQPRENQWRWSFGSRLAQGESQSQKWSRRHTADWSMCGFAVPLSAGR